MEGGAFTDGGVTTLSAPVTFMARQVESIAPRPERHRKVAILGFGKTVKDSPWQDPSWELWGMNGFWRAAEPDFGIKAEEDRYSLWFDLHTIEYTREYGKRAGFGDSQEQWLRAEHPFPVLMLDEHPDFPRVQRFPIEKVIAKVGRDYFTSSVAYALAFALTQYDIAEIGLWGIDLIHDTEYADQRPCAEYWLGRCESAGLKVTIHEGSAVLKQRARYGYDDPNPLLVELSSQLGNMRNALGGAIEKNRQENERLIRQMAIDDGALQMVAGLLGRLEAWRRGGRI